MRLATTIGLLLLASSAWAAKGVSGSGEAPVVASEGALNPAIQAAPYESQYGLTDQHRYQFNMGPKVTVDDLKARPYFKPQAKAATPSPAPVPPQTPTIKEEEQREELVPLTPTGRRSLVDAPMSPPLPVLRTPPPAKNPALRPAMSLPGFDPRPAVKAAPAAFSGTVLNASPISQKALENLKQPAVFNERSVPNLTPESAAQAGRADYGLRVIGAPTQLPVTGNPPGENGTPVGQGMPLPVVVEMKTAGAAGLSPQSIVNKLSDDAGFVVDAGFPMLMSSPNRQTAFLRGWVNSEKLMALTLNPSVVRVSVVQNSAPHPTERLLDVPVTLHLALPAQETVSSFIPRSVAGLEQQAGFRWRVSRGYQLARSSTGGTVILTGELPASSVDRLLAYPDLLRVEPYVQPAEPAVTRAPEAKAAPSPAIRRQTTVLRRATDLVVLTTAYPWMGILIREIFFWINLAVAN